MLWSNTVSGTAAIKWAVTDAFDYYLRYSVNKFVVYTDHKPALSIMNAKEFTNEKLYRWALLVQPHNFDLFYRPGKDLGDADGISRLGKFVLWKFNNELLDANNLLKSYNKEFSKKKKCRYTSVNNLDFSNIKIYEEVDMTPIKNFVEKK
eukprot:Awhi_evm2s14143